MSNLGLSREILSACARLGAREVVVCAGARNATFVLALAAARGVKTYSFFEERSAAFFALGRISATGRPVVVITTSGTAVAEALPAVIEADHQRLPLIILSADRPRRYRGTGAPQTITQSGLFTTFVDLALDVEMAWREADLERWNRERPLHLNVCFDEPLLDDQNHAWTWPHVDVRPPPKLVSVASTTVRRPLVVVGGLRAEEAAFVRPILQAWARPALLEATSRLRGHPDLSAIELGGGDPRGVDFDGVVRIGGVPTLRFWRDVEKLGVPTVHFSRVPLAGLPGEHRVHPLATLETLKFAAGPADFAADRERGERLEELLAKYPLSEPAWVRRLSEWIPNEANIFLGNSLPIREWDLAAARRPRTSVFANRGANGIDGLVSTFAGICAEDRANWAILGDLSTLYDLSGPWAFRERPIKDVTVAVINNGGGKIFARVFNDRRFENNHDLTFGAWAAQWGWAHQTLRTVELPRSTPGPRVLEVTPDDAETKSFWSNWELK